MFIINGQRAPSDIDRILQKVLPHLPNLHPDSSGNVTLTVEELVHAFDVYPNNNFSSSRWPTSGDINTNPFRNVGDSYCPNEFFWVNRGLLKKSDFYALANYCDSRLGDSRRLSFVHPFHFRPTIAEPVVSTSISERSIGQLAQMFADATFRYVGCDVEAVRRILIELDQREASESPNAVHDAFAELVQDLRGDLCDNHEKASEGVVEILRSELDRVTCEEMLYRWDRRGSLASDPMTLGATFLSGWISGEEQNPTNSATLFPLPYKILAGIPSVVLYGVIAAGARDPLVKREAVRFAGQQISPF